MVRLCFGNARTCPRALKVVVFTVILLKIYFKFFKSKALKKCFPISSRDKIQNENEILKSLDNEFILKFLDSFAFLTDNGLSVEHCLVTEYCQVK